MKPYPDGLTITLATADDAAAIADLLNAAANHLTTRYGKGHWSYQSSTRGVLFSMKGDSKLVVAKTNGSILGTLCLTAKKPWAIDPAYFTKVNKPIYLVGMAVHPDLQSKGIGSALIQKAKEQVQGWPAQSIRLDAFDAPSGAGGFYSKTGFTSKGNVIYRMTPLIYYEWLVFKS